MSNDLATVETYLAAKKRPTSAEKQLLAQTTLNRQETNRVLLSMKEEKTVGQRLSNALYYAKQAPTELVAKGLAFSNSFHETYTKIMNDDYIKKHRDNSKE